MQILFLGTGAADWPNPGPVAGEERRFSSLLFNKNILIDCGPMTLDAIEEFKVDINGITDIVISHPHEDHFSFAAIETLAMRRSKDLPPLTLHLNTKATERAVPSSDEIASRLTVKGYVPGDTFQCEKAAIQAVPANHGMDIAGELAAHLIVTTEAEERMFYMLDGSWLPSPSWGVLRSLKKPLNAIIWELTCGTMDDWRLFEHCNLSMIRTMRDIFMNYGVANDETRMFCSHICRRLTPQHVILAQQVKSNGFALAFDGMEYDSEKDEDCFNDED